MMNVLVQTGSDPIMLRSSEFASIRRIMSDRCGICFPEGKETLIQSRLAKRLRALSCTSYRQYLAYLERDSSGEELGMMIDALTTNKTSFFRESHHFEFIRSRLVPTFQNLRSGIRLWSAGCSTGEEPYSLAVLLSEKLPEERRKQCLILATDISHRVLATASAAIYSEDALQGSEASLLKKHMVSVQKKPTQLYRIGDQERAMVRFAYLNLADSWPMHGPFDAIFCRNVMIYFDADTRKRLVRRFWEKVKPGGYLFVGHSESLGAGSREFRYVEPAIYMK